MKKQVSKLMLLSFQTNNVALAQRHDVELLRHKQNMELQALQALGSCMQSCASGFQNVTARLDGFCNAWKGVSHPRHCQLRVFS